MKIKSAKKDAHIYATKNWFKLKCANADKNKVGDKGCLHLSKA